MRVLIITAFIVIFCQRTEAQPFIDLLNIHGQWTKESINDDKDSSHTETQFFSLDLSIPIKIKKDVLLFTPFVAQWEIKDVRTYKARTYSLPIAFVKQWKNENIKTSFVFITRTNHDPDESMENSLQLGGIVLHTIKKHERLKFKFGLYYNTEFFGPYFRPLLGIDWKVTERINVFGVLPANMNLEYFLTKSIHTGIAFRTYTNSYRQASDSLLRIDENYLKGFIDFYISKKHVFTLEAGHSILRKFRTGYREAGKTEYTDLKANDGYLIKIGYAYRLRLDDKY
ncbi:MAG: hypothetical protein KA444_09685 [Bacteroidia bacterium]|nr:hypothetical protein [Bacteroidia bacterium]